MAGPYYVNNKVDDVDYIEAADLEAIEAGFASVDEDKAEIAVPGTVGDFASLDINGNLLDSGKTPPSGEVVGTTDTQTLTHKTLSSPVLDSPNIATSWSIAGTPVSATAAELNILDGVTSSTAEINKLDGVTASTAEINILHGITATTSELNILDGVTASTAEINNLDGLVATASELNLLSGVTGLVVTESGTQTLTNKTLTAPLGVRVAMASNEIDLSQGDVFTKTISSATTFTVANAPATGKTISFVLELTNGGSSLVTWFNGIYWPLGSEPSLTAAGKDVIQLYSHDGGATWIGMIAAKAAGLA